MGHDGYMYLGACDIYLESANAEYFVRDSLDFVCGWSCGDHPYTC